MNIKAIAKYVDQPLVVSKISESAPAILVGASAALGVHDVFLSKNKENESTASRIKKNVIVLGTVASVSLLAARGLTVKGKKLFNGLIDIKPAKEIITEQTRVVTEYLEKNDIKDNKLVQILEKGKDKILKPKEVDYLLTSLEKDKNASELLETLLGKKEELTSKQIFGEIGRLSLLGLVPVAAGVGAGMLTDIGTNSKEKNCNRIKEGAYQYLANIFLCNVGAGLALFGLEGLKKANVIKNLTPTKKFVGMIGGILTTGVLGGSFIANYISKKFIDPMVLRKKNDNLSFRSIYDERTPEGVDMCMHIDDVATAGVLSGLKWIEPVLPVFYLFSGYRAGMGYRNSTPNEIEAQPVESPTRYKMHTAHSRCHKHSHHKCKNA